ncbi:D-isomer specific 2-hydroxyacid dehydrogenase family protein [Actinosynnema sp. NPDC053489]|uniref:D-isomer specific 2-hydroxyacid dehydrogenase family protein n=1 Tax=Actinosynnema sp. NPDC053489 TaxID=3363916 RepID=UPI0037C997B5
MSARVAIEPRGTLPVPRADDGASARRAAAIEAAVTAAGGVPTPAAEANALVWLSVGDPAPLTAYLDEHPGIEWVQLPWAGVENFAAAGVFDRPVTFTCAKASFAEQVGEHALAQVLALYRHFVRQARSRRWTEVEPVSLFRKRVTVLGAGGTARALIRLLEPFGCRVRVLRRSGAPLGDTETLPVSELPAVLPETDVLVLALALTPQTRGIIGAAELALLPPSAVLVNVARGAHVDTDALTEALANGTIAGAALDVTEPEPLPDGHPLWDLDTVLVTSHCADSFEFVTDQLAARVRENVGRFRRGEPLDGLVDGSAGY